MSHIQQNCRILILCAFFALLVLFPQASLAQFLPTTTDGPMLEVTPAYPEPKEPVTIRYANYAQTSSAGDLEWSIDGVINPAFAGQASLTLPAPALGKKMTVAARHTKIHNNTEARTTLIGHDIDIISESTTRAPYFYAGRRAPTIGSTIHLVAVPHLYTSSETRIPTKDLVFTWSMDNTVVKQARGDGSLTTTVPNIGASLVSLTVESSDSTIRVERVFSLELAEPSLSFYEYHGATGLSRIALPDNYLRGAQQVTVRAEPYFVDQQIYRNAQYGWSINGEEVSNNALDPQIITLEKSGEGTLSEIGFSVRNLSALSQYVYGLFKLEFE